jgi:HSP20 family molecular chaperone IbpA
VDKIHADLKDGVLALTIPRWQIEKKDVKKISISS